MSEYTPTPGDVRRTYARTFLQYADVAGEWFDRMIAEVRAEAWAEGYAAGQDSIYTATDEWPNPACVNPYRAALGLTAEQEGEQR